MVSSTKRAPHMSTNRMVWQRGVYKMSPREPCASYSERTCLKASGHMLSKPRFISSTAVQPTRSMTKPPLRHGRESDPTSGICTHLGKSAMCTFRQKRERNGQKNLVHVVFLDTH